MILITHEDGGGVERQVGVSAAQHRPAGRRAIVLRPGRLPDGGQCVVVSDGTAPRLSQSALRDARRVAGVARACWRASDRAWSSCTTCSATTRRSST